MSTCRFFIVKGESASKCFQPSPWLWHLREPSFPALMVRCPRDWVLDSESRAHCPPHDSCTQSHWDTEQQTCSQKSSYGCRKQSSLTDVTVSEWNMLPSQDLMFWWKEVKGLCYSWWQHPRDWVLQLDVSIQWHRTPGWLGAVARSMSVSEVCSVNLISPHHCTVSNVNLMSCKKTKIC